MVTPWGFESPLSHQKSATPYGVADIFMLELGLERAAPVCTLVQKVSGGHFLARGKVPLFSLQNVNKDIDFSVLM